MNTQRPEVNEEALFNIGAVTRMTGIPIATLHAWERRYGFPHSSARTQGGHRLYSEKDVTLLRCVKEQIDQGITASQAVMAVHRMDLEGRLPASHTGTPQPGASLSSSPASYDQLAEALFQHDLSWADQLMGEMLAFHSPEQIILEGIEPVLVKLGEAWAEGRITVADEHLASNYLRQRLLMWLVTGPPPKQMQPIVLACAPGELHEGSLLMLGVLLRRRGWPVTYLGQDVPFHDLAALVEQIQPCALVLVGMMEEPARRLIDWPDWIKPAPHGPLVTFAGRAFVLHPELQQQVQGLYLGDTIEAGLARLEDSLAR